MTRTLLLLTGSKRACALLVVLLAASAAAGMEESAESFRGAVRLTALPNGNVQLALDEVGADGFPDGIADHLFILEHAEAVSDLDLTFADATVTHAPGKLTLRSNVGAILRWRLTGSPEAEAMAAQRPIDHPAVLIGSGLSHHQGDFAAPVDEVAVEDFFSDVAEVPTPKLIPDGGGGVFCDSGGVGATQCSITCASGSRVSCSITCSSNNYACCDCSGSKGAKCKCYSNP